MHGLPHELFSSDKEQMGFSLQEAFKHAPTEVHMPLYRVKIDTNIYLQYHIYRVATESKAEQCKSLIFSSLSEHCNLYHLGKGPPTKETSDRNAFQPNFQSMPPIPYVSTVPNQGRQALFLSPN